MAVERSDPVRADPVPVTRSFGRLILKRLFGKSEASMAWEAGDPRTGQRLMLVLPRVQPVTVPALQDWRQRVQRASRLDHPHLAPMVAIGVQDGWPYVAHELDGGNVLADRPAGAALPGSQTAECLVQVLQGLAYAHEAGVAHHDLQPYLVWTGDDGQVRLMGLAVADPLDDVTSPEGESASADAASRRDQRAAARRDVLAVGVLLHSCLTGTGALDEPDVGRVLRRMPPVGREVLRLPWSLPQPVADPLRAIVNRATDRQERQRYQNARTFLRALDGWLQTLSGDGAGPLALLGDRLRAAGVLPAAPGSSGRSHRLVRMERERTNELAEVVLEDMALSFELLRLVNSASVRGSQISGSGPVLTVRRAIALLGLEGVWRAAAGLRPWPGPLDADAAEALSELMERCRRAARVAMMLRPAGYDGEVVYLLCLLQNLGRLVVQYHFADEAHQIRRLMTTAPPLREGDPEQPGMTEEAAAFAVLGAEIDAIGASVARHWGLDDRVLHMIRPFPRATPVRSIDSDDDMLRAVASCANAVIDAQMLPPARVQQGLQRVAQQYGRALGLGLRELLDALAGRSGERIAHTAPAPLDVLERRFGSDTGQARTS